MSDDTGRPDWIPFNRACLSGNEYAYMRQAVANLHLSGDGPFTKNCQSYLESALGVPRVLLTTNCTHALEMASLLLNVQPGDEIVLPAFTFVSTANAFALRGAKPVFVDIRRDTLNLDETLIERAISPRTRAIVTMHYAGVACEMDAIFQIASKRSLPVIEDNAHGLFGKYKDRFLGTLGLLGTQSFHETKNFTCGEGGALVINDGSLVELAEIVREKGTDRSRFFRGQVDKYTWVGVGSSYAPSDILAAFLLAQLQSREAVQERRRYIWETYARELQTWAAQWDVTLPTVPPECTQAYHLFYLLLPSLEHRQALIAHLRDREIAAVFHYTALNRSAMARDLGCEVSCPVTESAADRLLRLPFYNQFSEADQARVIEAITSFHPK
jgi:dTDP-4-amino-4,6-dideoxygalactose transaminase